MRILRGMRPSEDGLPRVGPTAKELGARPAGPDGEGSDIAVVDGMVRPGVGGMSVSPHPPGNIKPYRLPPEHGGTSKKIKLWEMDTDDLPEELRHVPDEKNPDGHVFIEPAREMTFAEYQRALESTRDLWTVV